MSKLTFDNVRDCVLLAIGGVAVVSSIIVKYSPGLWMGGTLALYGAGKAAAAGIPLKQMLKAFGGILVSYERYHVHEPCDAQ